MLDREGKKHLKSCVSVCNGRFFFGAGGETRSKRATHTRGKARSRSRGGGDRGDMQLKMAAVRSKKVGAVSCGERRFGGARWIIRGERSPLMLLLALALSLLCLSCRAAAPSSNGMLLLQPDQGDEQQHQQEEQEQGLTAAGRGLQSFPSVTNSTILFLHVFKVGATSHASTALVFVTIHALLQSPDAHHEEGGNKRWKRASSLSHGPHENFRGIFSSFFWSRMEGCRGVAACGFACPEAQRLFFSKSVNYLTALCVVTIQRSTFAD